MTRLFVRRLVQTIPVFLVSTVLVFMIVHLAPGDPAQTLAGPDATPAVVNAVRLRLGLNGPLYSQYISWLGGLFHGKLGVSYISEVPVSHLLYSRILASGELIIAGSAIAILVGVVMGSLAGFRPGGIIDSIVSWLTGVIVATPEFWIGLVAIVVFSVSLGWLPPEGRISFSNGAGGALKSLLLPACTLAFQPTALIARTVRASVVEILGKDYIRTAKAKGVGGLRFYFRHVLRNALIPILTIIGLVFTRLLGGLIVVESVFAWPGVGLLLVSSITDRDYQVIQATLLLFLIAIIAVNLLTDLSYAVADPSIRKKMTKS